MGARGCSSSARGNLLIQINAVVMIRPLLLSRHDLGDSGQRIARLRRTPPCGSSLIDIKAKPFPRPSPDEERAFFDWKTWLWHQN
jgi:hypothetical protein